ncbi:hypothetical protein [Streptomyces sp. NBC_00096]|uniref:hypothetical protein n=1 Tax=Streptomyces sp. NBC_00096 TaxID=2975650 RepID=UPI00324A7EDC
MADERDRWLDKAAADRLLRGEPVAPGAEHRSRARAERLRAALDALAEPPPAVAGELPGELRGEAAAVAAFRAARGSVLREEASGAELFGSVDTVVELSPPSTTAGTASRGPYGSGSASGPGPASASPSGRGRPVRFALAAALASVAVGGLAAAAGAGLLDRDSGETAAHAPAVSVSAGSSPEYEEGDVRLAPVPPPSTTVPYGGGSPGGSPTPGTTQGTEGRTPSTGDGGAASGGGVTTGPSANGATGDKGDRDEKGGKGRLRPDGSDGGTDGTGDKDREGRSRAVELCRDYRAGKLDEDRREKLVRLAKGLLRIPRYCQGMLDLTTGGVVPGGAPGGSPGRDSSMPAPTLVPALPRLSAVEGSGSRR